MIAFLLRTLWGATLAGFGLLLTLRTHWFLDFLGPIDWLEYKIGPGGTRLVYKLFGTVIVLAGFLVMTNLWDRFLNTALGSLIPAPRPMQ